VEFDQLRLFNLNHPLKERFSGCFFDGIPSGSGVYWMQGARGEVLYVGKAKSLRARVKSYRNTSFEKHAPKTQKLLLKVRDIHWEETPDEKSALLKENEWLRALKPPFNIANKSPETYLYFGFRTTESGLEMRLLFHLADCPADFRVYGAFKGIARTRRAHASVLRWLWAAIHGNCQWPITLTRRSAPLIEVIPWPKPIDALEKLDLFLSGILPLPEMVLPEETPDLFLQKVWRDDQVRLAAFFERGTRALRKLQSAFGLEHRPLRQDEVDDLIIVRKMRSPSASDTPAPRRESDDGIQAELQFPRSETSSPSERNPGL
jgi:hypothetical protein